MLNLVTGCVIDHIHTLIAVISKINMSLAVSMYEIVLGHTLTFRFEQFMTLLLLYIVVFLF